jgi:hypothetical protein
MWADLIAGCLKSWVLNRMLISDMPIKLVISWDGMCFDCFVGTYWVEYVDLLGVGIDTGNCSLTS